MKTARLFGPRDLRIIDLPEPVLGDHDVLTKVSYVGICGTDYSIYTGESTFVKNGSVKFPMTLGHEWSGIVEAVGKDVKSFRKGDRVIGDTAVSCGICYECLCGNYIQCANARCVGTINAWDGAYAEFILMPERHVFKVADNVPLEHAALVEPAATALYGVKTGDVVLVHGTGPIGLAAVQLAKTAGAACVILTGRKDFKLEVGRKLGADVAINILHEDAGRIISDLTCGKGPHVIIEASGSATAFKQSIEWVRSNGVISVVAFYEQRLDQIDLDSFIMKNAKLVAVAGSPKLAPVVLDMMKFGKINLLPLITHQYALDDVVTALDELKEQNETKIKVMLLVG